METVIRFQTRSSLVLLVAILFVFTGLAAGSRNEAVLDWLNPDRRLPLEADQIPRLADKGAFVDVGSRVFLNDIPRSDFSGGAVSLFGASTLASAVRVDLLPDVYRRYTHNWGIPAVSFWNESQLLHYLIDYEGLLEAGGEKNLVIFFIDYANATRSLYFKGLFRYGVYRWEPEGGLYPTPEFALVRAYIREHARATNLLNTIWRKYTRPSRRKQRREVTPELVAEYQAAAHEIMSTGGEDWEAEMDVQVGVLEDMLDLLRSRDVRVMAVLMPAASWYQEMDYLPALRRRLEPLFDEKGVDLFDWSHLLPDEDFSDHAHYMSSGSKVLTEKVRALIDDHVRMLAREAG